MTLAVFIVLVVIAASTGGIFKPDRWYQQLRKPRWTPPNGVFPVVWTILYAMIAAAGWLVWRDSGFGIATGFWAGQWVFNAAWSWLFFGKRRMDLGFYDIGLLWLCVAGFIATAWPVSTLASLLFVPYLVWVSIAALLNLSLWRLNPDQARP